MTPLIKQRTPTPRVGLRAPFPDRTLASPPRYPSARLCPFGGPPDAPQQDTPNVVHQLAGDGLGLDAAADRDAETIERLFDEDPRAETAAGAILSRRPRSSPRRQARYGGGGSGTFSSGGGAPNS